jgi:RimJ/RimL family protein N-acetyltransferase
MPKASYRLPTRAWRSGGLQGLRHVDRFTFDHHVGAAISCYDDHAMTHYLTIASPIETARLHIRPLRLDDAEPFRLLTDEAVIIDNVHFLTAPFTLVDAQELIQGDGDGRDCFWGVWRRDDGMLIGTVGVHLRGVDEVEIGYWFAGLTHGRGFGTEAVSAVVDAIGQVYADRRIIAECRPENTASWRLLEKIGFRADGRDGQRAGRKRLKYFALPHEKPA